MSQEYNKALGVLMKSPVTEDMIKFLTKTTLKVLPGGNSSLPSPPGSPDGGKQVRLPSLMTFITKLVRYTNVYTSTLLTTVCYLKKLQRILPKDATGLPSTIHRMFLACLIISAKYHNDSSPLNKHWAEYTDGLFSLQDVNLMEMQLLALLEWDLRINEEDLILDLRYLLEPIVRDLEVSYQRRRYLKMRQEQQLLQAQQQQKLYRKNFYNHGTNLSIDSNMSSITLTDSHSNESISSLRSTSTRYGSRASSPLYARTPVNSISNLHNKMQTEGQENSWDLEMIMSQHGF